jgi:hypothetical protein
VSSTEAFHFTAFMAASLIAFLALLWLILGRRAERPKPFSVAWVSLVVVVVGMVFAKAGANAGWSPLVYYGVPAATTVLLPPIVFGMRRLEVIAYICAASLVAPAIHVVFSLTLGWKEYLPFWSVPSLRELL